MAKPGLQLWSLVTVAEIDPVLGISSRWASEPKLASEANGFRQD